MMSVGFMPDSLNGSDPSKSAFLEFGHGHPAHQQHSAGLSHIYPVHGLHVSGHSQHEAPFPGNASYGPPLGYSYPGAMNAHPSSAYMSPYQHSSGGLSHSRLERTGMWNKQNKQQQQNNRLDQSVNTRKGRILKNVYGGVFYCYYYEIKILLLHYPVFLLKSR